MIIERRLTLHIRKMLKQFPIVSITGPRQSGKTTLLREFFPEYKYFNLERLDLREMILTDPMGFLKSAGEMVIFDEAQNLPELFSYIQVISDERKINGQYILSGSQSFLLNEKISQSLAGRVSINHLLPFELREIINHLGKDYLELIFRGFYPRIYQQEINPQDFYPSYLQTYVERDIRTLKAIENLNTFTKFLSMCAGRVGQVINLTNLANDSGISVNTAKSWLSLLEASYIIFLLKPYHKNFNKRIVKSPKLYFYDTGIVCSLLRLPDKISLRNYPIYGALFENLIISDIAKQFYHSGKQPNIFYYRESNGKEIDCIIEKNSDEIIAIEIKGGETFSKDYIKNFSGIFNKNSSILIKEYLIHPNATKVQIGKVKIIDWLDINEILES
jgi:predicted AAA+ superfamily ATPase